MPETEWEDFITCPVCGFVDEEMTDYPVQNDGDMADMTCSECGQDFRVAMSVSTHYRSHVPEGVSSPSTGSEEPK